jgi:hypothetical protein
MVLRSLVLAAGALLLCAATEPPPPPAALQPYIKDGRYDPGDYGWIKGRFQEATAEEAETFRAIIQWSEQCQVAARAELREQLAAAGFPDARDENTSVGPLPCRVVASQPQTAPEDTFAAFQRELTIAQPVVQAYLTATTFAEEAAGTRSGELARHLEIRTVGEQVIRKGLTWVMNRDSDFPAMSPLARTIIQSRLVLAMAEYDHANTEWLKGVVAEHGWPKISEVGEGGSFAAWLLVQHADADPLFQLQALRLMEPLVAQKEVSGQNVAYLTDRVMLKLTGKQRYGTQFTCVDGAFVPQPIEDEAAVERLRREAGMVTLAENTAQIAASYGRC